MKPIVPMFTLISCMCLGAEPAPPVAPITAEATPDTASPPNVGQIVNQALQTASRATQQALRTAQAAVQQAQANVALNLNDSADTAEGNANASSDDFGASIVEQFIAPGVRSVSQPLVVATSQKGASEAPNLQEDLTVMSRILTKGLEQEFGRGGHESAMGIVLSALPGARRPQSLYLEGYGAVFLLNVNFPLVAPPAKEEEKAEKSDNSTWEKTKQELYGPKPGIVRLFDGSQTGEAAQFNTDQVDRLKKEILESLKNATNIRDLKTDESITVAVSGPRAGSSTARVRHIYRKSANSGRADVGYAPSPAGRSVGRESTLSIRVKKSDVDGLAKGALSDEEFAKRAQVAAY